MKRRTHLFIRRSHRYLGLFLGIQFFLWTAGGLYFSWSDMDEIHGDLHRHPARNLPVNQVLASPTAVLQQLPGADSLKSLKLVEILGKPCYQVQYFTTEKGEATVKTRLADAATATLRPALTRAEAERMARQSFHGSTRIARVAYLTAGQVDGHHEYRESPLPAWAITMDHPSSTTVYVAAELGQVTKFRNDKWRIFDFLWMLHTMDYQGRDHIGNLLLRLFSIVGMVTIISGFALFFISRGSSAGKQKPRPANTGRGLVKR